MARAREIRITCQIFKENTATIKNICIIILLFFKLLYIFFCLTYIYFFYVINCCKYTIIEIVEINYNYKLKLKKEMHNY